MDKKKLDFIVKHFGCYTTIDGKQVLTSIANASRVPIEEFWNVFTGDTKKFFDIMPTEDKKDLSLVLDERIRKHVERECITNATS